MKLLLDSHVLIWSISADSRLSANVIAAIQNDQNELFVSTASLWELSIKIAQGKLRLTSGFDSILQFMERWSIQILPIRLDHVKAAGQLPFHHGDPFDRMLVAQAQADRMRLISSDEKIGLYGVDLFW